MGIRQPYLWKFYMWYRVTKCNWLVPPAGPTSTYLMPDNLQQIFLEINVKTEEG